MLLYKLWSLNIHILIKLLRHYINKDFNLKNYLLAIKPLTQRHLGKYTSNMLIDILKDYNIKLDITK